MVHKVEVPGVDLGLVFVMSKTEPETTNSLRDPRYALIVRPTDDELALATGAEIGAIFGPSLPNPRISCGALGR